MNYYKKLIGEMCYLSPYNSDQDLYEVKPFAVVDLVNNEQLGTINMININQLYQSCSLSITVEDLNLWSNGLVEDAIRLLLDYAFNAMNMHSVSLWLTEDKVKELECFENVGFKVMARRRKCIKKENVLLDNIYLDILCNEYSSVYINSAIAEIEARGK